MVAEDGTQVGDLIRVLRFQVPYWARVRASQAHSEASSFCNIPCSEKVSLALAGGLGYILGCCWDLAGGSGANDERLIPIRIPI